MLLSITMLMSFTSSNKDCGILKGNVFTYRNAKKEVVVVFKGDDYIEYHNNQEHFIKADIMWIGECEYYLIIRESTLPNFPFKMGTKTHIVVNKIRGKKVYYTTTLGGRSWEGRLTQAKRSKYSL